MKKHCVSCGLIASEDYKLDDYRYACESCWNNKYKDASKNINELSNRRNYEGK